MTDSVTGRPSPKILIFDSGVGGLSVLEAISRRHPQCGLIYASDNAYFPYGNKDEIDLVRRVNHVLEKLQAIVEADIIVIACNSASTLALPIARENLTQPVIGVVPAIKPAAQLSRTKIIGLLATPGTIKRAYTRQLIEDYASDCQMILLGSSELVLLAEQKLRGYSIHREELLPILAPIAEKADMDTLIMACTHFPLLKTELQDALPQVVYWVDSGDAIASRVTYWLEQLQLPQEVSNTIPPVHRCIFTAKTEDIDALKPYLQSKKLGDCQFIDVD